MRLIEGSVGSVAEIVQPEGT
ncbi:MAG: hypothetical protein WCF90_08155 [Methanomicrobiales archaeon]